MLLRPILAACPAAVLLLASHVVTAQNTPTFAELLPPSQNALNNSRITPEIFDDVEWDGVLQVAFDGVKIDPGQLLLVQKAQNPPSVYFTPNPVYSPDYSISGLHLLFLIDPDPVRYAPDILHGFWTNVRILRGEGLLVGKGTQPYFSPSPPNGSGLHRYIFALYHQPESFEVPKALQELTGRDAPNRVGFNITGFAAEHSLGSPIALTFFTIQG